MEGQVKFLSLQNTAGFSQKQSVAVFSQTTEVYGDMFTK